MMNLNYNKYYWFLLLSLLTLCNTAIAAEASSSNDSRAKLNVLHEAPIYLSQNKSSSREYMFKAPDSKTLSDTESLTAVGGYKVEVYGSAEDLLLRVRDIEPKAFVKGNVIQVGIFSQQDNAEDMVRKLTSAGLWARIVAQ